MRVSLELRDRVAQLGVADRELTGGQARRRDQRIELEEEDDVEVADAGGDVVDEAVIAPLDRGRGRPAAATVDQAVGRQHHGRAGLRDLGLLQVVGDPAGDVGSRVPHVETVRAGL